MYIKNNGFLIFIYKLQRVTEKNPNLSESLYVLHRNAMLGVIDVRLAQMEDETVVFNFLKTIHNMGPLYFNEFMAALYCENDSVFPLVIRCEGTVIGVVLLRQARRIVQYEKHNASNFNKIPISRIQIILVSAITLQIFRYKSSK